MAFISEQDDEEVMSEINMTPLVDVMLVLLIIFMLTVPVLTQSLDIELPKTSSAQTSQENDVVDLSVNVMGQVFWDEEQIDQTQLQSRLDEAALLQPQPQLHIRGDRATEYEHVMRLMAAAQEAGLTRLGFVTEVD